MSCCIPRTLIIAISVSFEVVLPSIVVAQSFFAEVTKTVNAPLFPSRSTAFGDYDNDGWPDMLAAESAESIDNQQFRLALLHNELVGGTNRFTDQTALIQTSVGPTDKGGGAIFGDYDNDGDLDVFVPVGAYKTGHREPNLLLRNDRSLFTDIAREVGLTDSLPTDNALWLDYDRDGYLDLYTGNLACDPSDPKMRNKLYHNSGGATFTDVTTVAGLDFQFGDCGGSNGGMVAADFDNDGWTDLYVGVFDGPNHLFLNTTQGGFREKADKVIADPGGAWGIAVGDIDNDGDLDIFKASRRTTDSNHPALLLNANQGNFVDFTDASGLSGLARQKDLLAAGFADIDNDGDLDLLTGGPFLFLNNGRGTFTDQTIQSGISEVYLGMSIGDYDLDGFLDVWFGYSQQASAGKLYHNQGNDNHWLQVELVGIQSNRNGIGARLVAISGDIQQTQVILGGMGYNQHEMVAHFGLGQRTLVDQLEVHWPSGQVDVLKDIPSDQKIRVIEGRSESYTVRPALWKSLSPLPTTLTAGTTIALSTAISPTLFEEDAQVVSTNADMSGLRGVKDTSLRDWGDGTYRSMP